ncbi:MAG: Dihydrofolate reductase [Sphingomonadales bacterium]|nr:Dihydrofolate reductase [Sphingomonadales bacterium]
MTKVTCGVAMSLDGFVAGNNMSLEEPFGDASPQLFHSWQFVEPEKHKAERDALTSAGAFIMGRNMFGPKELQNDPNWKGWWDENPPYHAPVFVLSHTEHEAIPMDGGTTFYFVTDGIESALKQAKAAAGSKDVAISGGANVINQYLAAGLIDELWLHIAPVTIGSGQRLFKDTPGIRLKPLEVRTTDLVTHIKYAIQHSGGLL